MKTEDGGMRTEDGGRRNEGGFGRRRQRKGMISPTSQEQLTSRPKIDARITI